jgi:type VI secretion system secreted protein Hcp
MFATARARRPRRLGLERLEGREVPAALATFPGEVTAPRQPDWVQMQVQPTGSDRVLLSFESTAADGSALRPGGLRVFAGDGARGWAAGPAGRPGFALKEVSAGMFFARVAGARGTTGEFDVTVSLAGDVTGDEQVSAEDLDVIRGLHGRRAGQDGFEPAADVNHNGIIGLGDLRLARRNLDTSAEVGPLTADQFLFAGSDALGLTRGGSRAFDPATAPKISLTITNILGGAPLDLGTFGWAVTNPGGGGGGGGGAGRPIKTDFVFTKTTDAASPQLFAAVASGTHYQEANLFVGRRGGGPGGSPYLQWEMKDVVITSYSVSGSEAGGGVNLAESVSLSFQSLEVTFYPKLPNGKAGDPVSASYDFAEGTGS